MLPDGASCLRRASSPVANLCVHVNHSCHGKRQVANGSGGGREEAGGGEGIIHHLASRRSLQVSRHDMAAHYWHCNKCEQSARLCDFENLRDLRVDGT